MGMDSDYAQDLVNTRNEEHAKQYRRGNEPITYDEVQEHQYQQRLKRQEKERRRNEREEYV